MTKLRWTNILLMHTKLLAGMTACDMAMKGNLQEAITRRKNRNDNIICQRIGDQLPDAMKFLEEARGGLVQKNNGGGRMATFDQVALLVKSRVDACLPSHAHKNGGNELRPLLRPELLRSVLAMGSLVEDEKKVIRIYDLYDIQEEALLAKDGDGPGAYIHEDPNHPASGYIGSSKNVRERNKGHSNAHHRLALLLPTESEMSARQLELSLLRRIAEHYKCYPEFPTGAVTLLCGTPITLAVAKLLELPDIRNHFHNHVRLNGEKSNMVLTPFLQSILQFTERKTP